MKRKYNFYIISARRPQNVERYIEHTPDAIWVVPKGEGEAYIEAGAKYILESGGYPGLISARNEALWHCYKAGKKYCIQCDDDLKKVFTNKFHEGVKEETVPLNHDLLQWFVDVAQETGMKLVGIPPTDNPFFAKPEMGLNKFIIASFFCAEVTNIRFDPNMLTKEDYDFTLQHIKKFGEVLRMNKYMFMFQHYKNAGGVVDYRTAEGEEKAIQYLEEKWGAWVIRNTKRPGEVILRVR